MRRIVAFAASLVLGAALPFSVVSAGAGKESDKDMGQFRGVWKQPAPKGKGPGGYNTLVFDRNRLLWVITHTLDGEPLSGVSLPCTYQIDPKAKPKTMTISRWDLKHLPTKQAIYEVNGDTLRLCIGIDGKRPRNFAEKEGQLLTFTRDSKAKTPELVWEKETEVQIKPRQQWLGQVRDRKLQAQCPKGPITRQEDFAKLWKMLRGAEQPPKVDFAKEFVLVETSSFGMITEIRLHYRRGRVGIGVFARDRVDVVGGRVTYKK
jgi:uncharacterized protein (TIGR03067 family)